MKIGSPTPHKKARIEIIPLIDIMFFLLASFMMVSITMVKMQSIKMDLPTATQARRDFKPEIINIAVDKTGECYIEKQRKSQQEVYEYLTNRLHTSAASTNLPVYISGDKNATHGAVIAVLDLVRRAGIQKVSFAITPQDLKE
ncbi:MAG: biopolymer transporter ExbD [Verrucomicrobia bacterium]|nr:biopolymer transporter ExbD [Verrucomicrobiota bacterium]